MATPQLILSLVLACMVFSVALDLRIEDFRRVAKAPRAVVAGLIPQFVLLPVATWLATLALDLPPATEAAMMLVASCPGGTLATVREMLGHPRALSGLSDAGAHVGTVCDASFTTFMLTHWVQGRAEGRLPLEHAVHLLTARNAAYLGLADRGRIAVGQRADLNLIDPQRLAAGTPRLVRDLPAGGKRFLQKGEGYLRTWVAGRCVQQGGEITAQRPGRLVRLGHPAG
jgi:N-acyl-D-aspartate/D-glutamate deacylase